ncbi:MAG: hypothetical protein ACK4JY_02855 [Brevundimonas sp.]|uniref:hypothetical protein n=1 Tax=Brevundimonas sp. TaxID=1871086 RepID=UPI00391DB4DC
MAKAPETTVLEKVDEPVAGESVDAALRATFTAVEAEAVPARLADHIVQLSSPGSRPDRRS